MHSCCIIVPIYKEFDLLTPKEVISITQLCKVLGKHHICFIGSTSLQWNKYLDHAKKYSVDVMCKHFADFFFNSLEGYNKLLLSKKFYKLFAEYKYILIYQTDAFVFKDDLDYWCDENYDYIGSPWFEGWGIPLPEARIIGVGNGGFSLRKIESVLEGLDGISYSDFKEHIIGRRKRVRTMIKQPYYRLLSLFGENVLYHDPSLLFEDRVISDVIASKKREFKIPSIDKALQFGFEVNPRKLFEMNNYRLPMGCHAWWRYDLEFWKPHIESFGYRL
jgi:hypothetical protein